MKRATPKLKYIEIMRAEGPTRGTAVPVGKKFRVKSAKAADTILRKISYSMPKTQLGYDKTDVKIVYGKRNSYSGRWDVTARGEDTSIVGHLREMRDYGVKSGDKGYKSLGRAAGRVIKILSRGRKR